MAKVGGGEGYPLLLSAEYVTRRDIISTTCGYVSPDKGRCRDSQDMIAVRIKPTLRFTVVGSPAYFQGRKPPRSPGDLNDHTCIRYRFPSGSVFNWEFEREGDESEVVVHGPLAFDSQELMVEAALAGCGLAYVWDARVVQHLSSGALIRCLDKWCPPNDDLCLYYPSRRYVSAGLRALIDKLKATRLIGSVTGQHP